MPYLISDRAAFLKSTSNEVLNEAYTKNYYSFVPSTNSLYLGRVLLTHEVSKRLVTPPVVIHDGTIKKKGTRGKK